MRQVARFGDVWVITRANNRQSIEKALARELLPNVRFVYFDLPRWARFWKKGHRCVHVYYYLWQLGAYFVAKQLHRTVSFDFAHHATLGTYWLPSFLALLPIPFVWGPLGGGESAPRSFWRSFSLRGKVYETARDLARCWARLDPLVRLTACRAELALATTSETAEKLRLLGCRRIGVLSHVGLPDDEIQRLSRIPPRHSLLYRVGSFGCFLHWKGFELGLKAFAQFHRRIPESEYWLIGDGPERKRLERLTRELGLGDCVRFWGQLAREELLERLAECDVVLHPSLHDSGGWVCAEALSAARPVICLDLGGPALQVTAEVGIKIPATSPGQVLCDLAAALTRLEADPGLRLRLAQAGRRRVQEHFTWNAKGDLWNEVLESAAAMRIGC